MLQRILDIGNPQRKLLNSTQFCYRKLNINHNPNLNAQSVTTIDATTDPWRRKPTTENSTQFCYRKVTSTLTLTPSELSRTINRCYNESLTTDVSAARLTDRTWRVYETCRLSTLPPNNNNNSSSVVSPNDLVTCDNRQPTPIMTLTITKMTSRR